VPEAFECDERDTDGLSLTAVAGSLSQAEAVVRYANAVPVENKPGICKVDLGKLIAAQKIKPVLSEVDGEFGDRHYVIDCPDKDLADLLAKKAVIELFPIKGKYIPKEAKSEG
jgi:hypothetical protein